MIVWIMYLLPVVAIVFGLGYSFWFMQRNKALVAAGHGPEMFHNTYSPLFSSLQPNERIVSLWVGAAFTGPSTAAGQLASGVLNAASGSLVGVSSYTPVVHIARTSFDRVMVTEEYSEMGKRGNHRQVLCLGPGTQALDAQTALPGHYVGPPPRNECNPLQRLEFAQLRGASGETYDVWVPPVGNELNGLQRRIQDALAAPPAQPPPIHPAAQPPAG